MVVLLGAQVAACIRPWWHILTVWRLLVCYRLSPFFFSLHIVRRLGLRRCGAGLAGGLAAFAVVCAVLVPEDVFLPSHVLTTPSSASS